MAWGAIIGAVASIAGSAIKAGTSGGGAPKMGKVDLSGVNLMDPSSILGMYSSQMQAFPGLRQTTQQLNQAATQDYTGLINTLYPGATSQLNQLSTLAGSFLKGQIPTDVQNQIQRATAQQAMTGGFSGTGMGANLTARDLGLTSMNLTSQGMNMFNTGLNIAKGMIPGYINPASLLFSPAQLGARVDQANYYNTSVKNQQQMINANRDMEAAAQAQASQQQMGNIWGSAVSGLSNLFVNSKGQPTTLGTNIGNWISGLGKSGSGDGLSYSGFSSGLDTSAVSSDLSSTSDYTDLNVNSTAGEF